MRSHAKVNRYLAVIGWHTLDARCRIGLRLGQMLDDFESVLGSVHEPDAVRVGRVNIFEHTLGVQ
jgi:hypothetical protein